MSVLYGAKNSAQRTNQKDALLEITQANLEAQRAREVNKSLPEAPLEADMTFVTPHI